VTYVDIAGVRTYYEVSGQGEPVVLLHGALSGADGWSLQVPLLAAEVAVEQVEDDGKIIHVTFGVDNPS